MVVTDLGVFEPLGDAFLLREVAPGYTPEEVQALTAAPVKLPEGEGTPLLV
jgi:3-oxoacid CoA-transferase subunit B